MQSQSHWSKSLKSALCPKVSKTECRIWPLSVASWPKTVVNFRKSLNKAWPVSYPKGSLKASWNFLVTHRILISYSKLDHDQKRDKIAFKNKLNHKHNTKEVHKAGLTLTIDIKERGRDLTQSYDISPYTHRKFQKATWQHKKHQKLRLHNDCGSTYDGQLQ